jgi:hypothetical protein
MTAADSAICAALFQDTGIMSPVLRSSLDGKRVKPNLASGLWLPNGLRVSGERRREAEKRVRHTRVLGRSPELR